MIKHYYKQTKKHKKKILLYFVKQNGTKWEICTLGNGKICIL